MKHQQVVVDYWTMAKTSFTYLILVMAAWFMFRLFNAVFLFPKIIQRKHEEIARRIEEQTKKLQESMDHNKDDQILKDAANTEDASAENQAVDESVDELKKEK
ncbi:hypothetical protein DMENIID0001_078500 [Sergentomyia squamirostris]